MVVPRIQVDGFQCGRCEHIWTPRNKESPKVCPRCKSPYWDTPRKNKQAKQK